MVSANDECTNKINGTSTETGLEVVALLHVAEFPEPVDDLAVAVVAFGRPFTGVFLTLSSEQTLRSCVLEFDEVVRSLYKITDHEVTLEVTEQIILECNSVDTVDDGLIPSRESGKMGRLTKERENRFSLCQSSMLGKESSEVLDFLSTLLRIPDEGGERLHVGETCFCDLANDSATQSSRS